jgi:hypothetical protein
MFIQASAQETKYAARQAAARRAAPCFPVASRSTVGKLRLFGKDRFAEPPTAAGTRGCRYAAYHRLADFQATGHSLDEAQTIVTIVAIVREIEAPAELLRFVQIGLLSESHL